MKKSIPFWQMMGFIFVSVLGTFLHFLFDLTGGSWVAALFSAVNESIWEHMKLLYYPMVVFSIVEYCVWGKKLTHFWCVKVVGILLGLILIPMLYYTYTGILGVNADWFNIAIFFLAAGAAFWLETKLFRKPHRCPLGPGISLVVICFLALLFSVYTFLPPEIPFFRDPLTGTYGFQIA